MRARRMFRTGLVALGVVLAIALSGSIAFAAAAIAPPPAPPPPPPPPPRLDSLAFIQKIAIGTPPCDSCPPQVCPGEPVRVTVSGLVPAGCVAFQGLHELAVVGGTAGLVAEFVVDTCGRPCPDLIAPFSASILLPAQPSGPHPLVVEEARRVCPDTSLFVVTASRFLSYDVLPSCAVSPPPLDSLVRTFTFLRTVPERPCARDSVTLQLVKRGCPPCVHLDGLAHTGARGLVASLSWVPACVNIACLPETLSLSLGAFAAGHYQLEVTTDVHVLGGGSLDTTISYPTRIAFDVVQVCDTTSVGCLHASLPPQGSPVPECSLRLPPGGRGDVLVPVRNDLTTLGVAGVEGLMTTFPPFHIVDIQYAGAAGGVHVSWQQDSLRSRFVVFGASGDVVPHGTSDLLRISVVEDSLGPPDILASPLFGEIRLASDPEGGEAPICPELRPLLPSLTLCIDRSALGCDVNGDGHADVRDLVLMAHCLARAPGDTLGHTACFDCDHDGVFGIPDLFCCAHEILHGPGIPHDSARVEPGLSVTLDPPARDGGTVRVRLHLRGASSLGAALLRLRYPADRWQVLPPGEADLGLPAGWMPLTDASEAGLLRLGALRLSGIGADELVYELRAVPVNGAEESGALSVEGADFTAPDGAVLTSASPLPSTELSPAGPPAVLELSPARPNPFTRSTTFAIGLPHDAQVDLAVHDLAGRRVTTLAHGRLAAGRREFTWDGAGVHDGLYFVRLVVDGRVLSTRAALLKGAR